MIIINKKENVLITGSSRGIGKAIAKKFLENKKYNVIINSNKNTIDLIQTFKELKKINKNIIAVKSDVSKYHECEILFKKIYNAFGNVDILINNAGISYFGLFQDMSIIKIKKIIDTNLFSVINCSRLAVKNMIKKKKGKILNISSVFGLNGASCESIYSCAKGAVNIFTKSLAKELAPCNIQVNAIACGMIKTKMNCNITKEEKDNLRKEIPSGDFGLPNDIAELVFFLSNNKLKYLNGEIIRFDGCWDGF